MKKMFATVLAIICLLGSLALSVAAEQNYCDVFEANMNFFLFQTADAASGKAFSPQVVVYHTLQYMDTSPYAGGESGLTLTIPQDVFETQAMKYFDVDAAHLRAMQLKNSNIYDASAETYTVTEFAGGGFETAYAVRGYTEESGRYTVYYSLVERGYEKTADAVEGEDYILNENGEALKLTGQHVKATVGYNGKERKFYSWEHIGSLPDLSGMVTPIQKVTTTTQDNTVTTTTTADNTATTTKTTGDSAATATTTVTGSTASTHTTVKNGRITTTGNGYTAFRTTIPTEPMETLYEKDGVVIQAASGTFPQGTMLSALLQSGGATNDNARRALSRVADLYTVYELSAVSGGKPIEPKGKVSVTFAIPEGYEPSRTAVVYISPGGAAEILVSKVDTVAGTVTADVSHFSTYAVAQLYTANVADGPNATVFFIIVAVIAVAVGCVVYIFMRKHNAAVAAGEEPAAETAAEEETAEEATALQAEDEGITAEEQADETVAAEEKAET